MQGKLGCLFPNKHFRRSLRFEVESRNLHLKFSTLASSQTLDKTRILFGAEHSSLFRHRVNDEAESFCNIDTI
jgi:hypothetical protein